MPVKIRLTRMGSKRRPFYRLVVVDSRDRRDGRYLDQVGWYNPIAKPHELKVDEDKVAEWLGKGAQLSDGAASLLKKAGTLRRLRGEDVQPKEETQAAEKAPEPAKAAEPEEAPEPEPAEAAALEAAEEPPEEAAPEPAPEEPPKEVEEKE
jgi:small subunit ribosomal protein S16